MEIPALGTVLEEDRGHLPFALIHGEALVAAVRGCEFPAGRVHAFVHGEATFVKDLRAYLRLERGPPMDQLSISGYWRRGLNEDGWQSSKREWNQQVEREQEATA